MNFDYFRHTIFLNKDNSLLLQCINIIILVGHAVTVIDNRFNRYFPLLFITVVK